MIGRAIPFGVSGMCALGQKRTFPEVSTMSALPLKADISQCTDQCLLWANTRHRGGCDGGFQLTIDVCHFRVKATMLI